MKKSIRIAIASGKGGTGKTTISTSLAYVLSKNNKNIAYVDCDVEEPNGHLFLNPVIVEEKQVSVLVPQVDHKKCINCNECGKKCNYSAILPLLKKTITFPELCHGCGACSYFCPPKAISEVERPVGIVKKGWAEKLLFLGGKLNIGEAMAPPVIRAVQDSIPDNYIVIQDAPPGTSCSVIESVSKADVVVLVTEPTPFGLNDLKLAVQMCQKLRLSFGVVINRCNIGNDEVLKFCNKHNIPILLELEDNKKIAWGLSRGELDFLAMPGLKKSFEGLFEKICSLSNKKINTIYSEKKEKFVVSPNKAKPSSITPNKYKKDIFELVIISGKGGTGKTSISASLFCLAKQASIADCDVDAANLHIILDPEKKEQWLFSGGKTAIIDSLKCNGCGICYNHCRFSAISNDNNFKNSVYKINSTICEGCGFCYELCPEKAIQMKQEINGKWFLSQTRLGPMTHATLGVAQENSGKLVSTVREEGTAVSILKEKEILICDGAPGIGCPVIASITGANMALIVTEPTVSGLHDLKRVSKLCRQLNIKGGICINKIDLNIKIASEIEKVASDFEFPVLGRIRYDRAVTHAQVSKKTVMEFEDGIAKADILDLWKNLNQIISAKRERKYFGT